MSNVDFMMLVGSLGCLFGTLIMASAAAFVLVAWFKLISEAVNAFKK